MLLSLYAAEGHPGTIKSEMNTYTSDTVSGLLQTELEPPSNWRDEERCVHIYLTSVEIPYSIPHHVQITTELR